MCYEETCSYQNYRMLEVHFLFCQNCQLKNVGGSWHEIAWHEVYGLSLRLLRRNKNLLLNIVQERSEQYAELWDGFVLKE